MEFFTIGVYNSKEEEFFAKIINNHIDTFCDIRQRRGVRGAKYSYVNSRRLQLKLQELDVRYGHEIGLAPTTRIRDLQKQADAQQRELKRDRNKLGQTFTNAYKDEVLFGFDFQSFLDTLEEVAAQRIVLFCVEEKPAACHRSIVAKKLRNLGYKVTDI